MGGKVSPGVAVETHWTQTAHLERRWGVVREAPNVVANLRELFVLLGVFWGFSGVPWDAFGVPFCVLLAPGAPFWLPFGTPFRVQEAT